MTAALTSIPRSVLVYGLLGLIPFLAPPVAGVIFPDARTFATSALSLYAALILSFLGGARWGLEVARPAPSPWVITVAMAPSLGGWAFLLSPENWGWARLPGLAIALGLHWIWDIRSEGLPVWYPALRTVLTIGAVIGLIAGAAVLAP